MTRNTFLDYTKGILILLVCIGHAIQVVLYHEERYWNEALFKAIYMFHMPLFMAISGYLSYPGIQRSTLATFIIGKASSYLLPILVWATLFCSCSLLLTAHPSFTSLPEAILHEAVGSYWFLWALFGSLLITMTVQKIGQGFVILSLLAFGAVLLLPEKGTLYLFKYTLPFFQAGYLIAAYGVPSAIKKHPGLSLIIVALPSVICYLAWNENSYIYLTQMTLIPGNAYNIIFRYVASLIVSVFFILLFFQIHPRTPEGIKRVLITFGRDSIFIYLLQEYVFLAVAEGFQRHPIPFVHESIGAALGVGLGLVVAPLCWLAGTIIARSQLARRLLFGSVK